MLGASDTKQLIDEYQKLRQRMQDRIQIIAGSYEHSQPLSLFFAMLHDDPDLEEIDQALCKLEQLLPEWYQFDNLAHF